ncbi:hypothetical protein [Calothrix sp. CCY 0018]|uniref:YrrC family ATP-dependent DNA helicase n=1 Tax=Calothrix sp. CCY 0018 TaxID=3103864 RepID=UPI0039C637F3
MNVPSPTSTTLLGSAIRYNYRVPTFLDKMIPAAQSSNQQQANTTQQFESITGVIERLTFYSQESGYTVARLQVPRMRDLTTIVGSPLNASIPSSCK